MRLGRGRCGWWSTPTEPPSGKEKPRLSEVFCSERTGSAEKALSWRARSVATLDIVHGVANDNLQCFSDHVRGHHVIGGFQRLNQP